MVYLHVLFASKLCDGRTNMNRLAGLTALVIVFVGAVAIAQPQAGDVPAAIKVPDGHKLVAKFDAKGVQVYIAIAGKSGTPEWVFEEPLADLWEPKAEKVGIHYYGPAWEAADGSKVIKDDDRKVRSADAPKPAADLPCLLVPVRSDDRKGSKSGKFSSVV